MAVAVATLEEPPVAELVTEAEEEAQQVQDERAHIALLAVPITGDFNARQQRVDLGGMVDK